MVACILRLDPSLAAAVVAAALSDSEEWPQQVRTRLAPVQHWAREPPLAQLLAAALLQRGTDLAGSGKREAAGHLLDAAEAVSPELREQCARKRIEWIKKDLGEKDYSGAFSALYGMHTDNYSTGVCAEIASLLLEVAQQLAKKSPAIAERAVDKAFQLQPSLGDSEANVVLWITVHQEPNSEKLRQCQRFLSTFSKSEQYGDVQMQIIGDAIAFARSGAGRIANREMDTAYCDAACAMAAALLEKNPPPKELNPQAWTLAECLADVGQHGKAVQTAELFLKAFPDTPLKKEIEGKLPDWRNLPKIGLYVPIPGRGQGHDTLEAKLLRRKRTIDTSTAVYDAVANKEIWIIEVADACTADQFNAEQTRLLRNWVSEGGVLWVNSNVLDLFGVRHSRGSDASFAHCIPAGPHPILEGVNLTLLDELKDKALTLSYRGVIPLLAVKQEGRNEYFEPPAGTTAWSLVPFGKGWISDPKPLGLNEGRLSPGRGETRRGLLGPILPVLPPRTPLAAARATSNW